MAIGTIRACVVLAILASLPFSSVSAQSQSQGGDASDYARAETLVHSRAWDEGLAILVPLLAHNPGNTKAWNLAGLACAGKGDLPCADQYFQKSLAVDPNFTPALKNLSINEFNAQKYELAEKHLLEAQKRMPNDPVVSLFLGQIAYREQKFKLAAEHLDRARDLVLRNPNLTAALAVSLLHNDQQQPALELLNRIPPTGIDVHSQLALGVSLAAVNLDAQAVPYLQAAFQNDPDSYDTGFDLALASLEAKDFASAIAASDELIRRQHDKAELEDIRAEALEASGETQRAVDAYRKAVALNPEDENTYLDFASLCIDHRSLDDGMKVISVGLQVHPKSEQLTFMRGILNAMQDHFELAEQDFHQAALLAPQHDFGYIGLGVTYLELGNSEKAIAIIRDRLRERPNDASLLYLLGEGLLRSGANPGQPAFLEAQSALEKSIQLDPRLCLPHISLGSIYLDQEKFADAAAQFEQARAIDPSENAAYSHLAIAYRRLGEPEKARQALEALKQVLTQQRAGMRVKVQTPEKPDTEPKPSAKPQ